MNKVLKIALGVFAVGLICLLAKFIMDGNANITNFDDYDFYTIIGPNKDNGNIGDHVKGSADAPVVIFEYADFQCSVCSVFSARVNELLEKYDGKLAIVYRNFLLSYHQNATAAASSAEAASLQGYWEEYADLLFANQAEWEYASATERTKLFERYFTEASDGKGDLEKFRKDVSSSEVSKRLSFDAGIGRRTPEITGTPSFFIDGQLIDRSQASYVVIDGEVVSWTDETDFMTLMEDIIEAKLRHAEN